MKYKKYLKYKDSGTQWLHYVPKHWKLQKLGQFFLERKERVSDKDFKPLSVTKNGIVAQLTNIAKTSAGDNRKKVCKGDFVINSRSDRRGSSGLSSLTGSVSLISIVLTPQDIDSLYIHYLLKSQPFQEEFYRFGKGIVADLWSTNYSEMKKIIVPVPSKREQQKIAAFLNKETAAIDNLVAKQQLLVKLLQEKRQAIISHAVTKGLHPDVSFKDSGIEGLGEMPAHWETKRLKYVCELINVKQKIVDHLVVALENIESKTGNYLKTNMKYKGEGVSFLSGDILFGKLRPYLAKVLNCNTSGIAFGDILVYRAKKFLCSKFIYYTMLSTTFIDTVNSAAYGTKMPRASPHFINNLQVMLPPKEEQVLIAEFLDSSTTKIDHFITKLTTAIQLMQERRAALIAAAVTGKIDVTNTV